MLGGFFFDRADFGSTLSVVIRPLHSNCLSRRKMSVMAIFRQESAKLINFDQSLAKECAIG